MRSRRQRQQRQATRTDLDPLVDAPEITFHRWCCNNRASGRDRRDFRACLRVSQSPTDRQEKKGDDLVFDSNRDLSSSILKRS